ncbi:MAG: VWA domain-containing protein [Halioglobus sp.]
MELHLIRPEWLWSLLPALVLAWLQWRQRERSGSWSSVIAPQLLQHLVTRGDDSSTRNWTPLLLLAWMIAAVAAAGPSWEKIPQPVHKTQDALVLLLDLSYSMKSADLAPSRIDRARQKLLDLLQRRREGQTGLIAYAGDSHIVTPLTDDTPTIANLLPALHPDMMPVPGSDPAAAVRQAIDLLHSAGVSGGQILLVTDAVREQDIAAIEALLARTAAQLSVLGVGTRTGAPIPLPRGGFVKDQDGTIVMPGLDIGPLRELANRASGRFQVIQVDDADLDYLLAAAPLPASEQTVLLDRSADTWDDKGYLLVLLLLPIVLVLFRRGVVLCLACAMLAGLLVPAGPAFAQALPEKIVPPSEQPAEDGWRWDDLWLTRDQQASRALSAGDAERAAALFERRDWAGTAAYQSGDYTAASEHFGSAEDDADALYNRGNALARQGELDEAIEAYKQSLAQKPEQRDALENLALLEQLKQQQEQQQQNQDQQQNQEQQQQQDQQQNQDQQQQGQQQQNQGDGDSEQSPNAGENGSPPPDSNDQERDASSGAEDKPPQEQPGQQNADQVQEPEAENQPGAAQADAQEPAEQDQAAQPQPGPTDPEQAERDQAMEQWLRRVPDDPSGLLRQKFRYESELRKQEGHARDSEQYW